MSSVEVTVKLANQPGQIFTKTGLENYKVCFSLRHMQLTLFLKNTFLPF